jgi:hypothetical protein
MLRKNWIISGLRFFDFAKGDFVQYVQASVFVLDTILFLTQYSRVSEVSEERFKRGR